MESNSETRHNPKRKSLRQLTKLCERKQTHDAAVILNSTPPVLRIRNCYCYASPPFHFTSNILTDSGMILIV